MNRIQFFTRLMLVLAAAGFVTAPGRAATQRRNLLIITADDLNADSWFNSKVNGSGKNPTQQMKAQLLAEMKRSGDPLLDPFAGLKKKLWRRRALAASGPTLQPAPPKP